MSASSVRNASLGVCLCVCVRACLCVCDSEVPTERGRLAPDQSTEGQSPWGWDLITGN